MDLNAKYSTECKQCKYYIASCYDDSIYHYNFFATRWNTLNTKHVRASAIDTGVTVTRGAGGEYVRTKSYIPQFSTYLPLQKASKKFACGGLHTFSTNALYTFETHPLVSNRADFPRNLRSFSNTT